MSVSKSWTQDPANISAVLAAYRNDPPLIVAAIATNLGTTAHNISHVLEKHMSASELKARKALRYSISKEGERNPMKGKTKEQHHNWIGECSDCKGYLTILHNGVRQFVHRVVMAEALGLPMLPEHLEVHHIDEDPANNVLDNLALVTRTGHEKIHSLQVMSALEKSRRSTIAAIYRSGTSP